MWSIKPSSSSLAKVGAAIKSTDKKERGKFYQKAQDLLNDEVPWLPIYSMINFLTYRKSVVGVGYQNPFTWIYVGKDAKIKQ